MQPYKLKTEVWETKREQEMSELEKGMGVIKVNKAQYCIQLILYS